MKSRYAIVSIALTLANFHNALAQLIGAGGQIQQITPAPVLAKPEPQLPFQPPVMDIPLTQGTEFPVKSIVITGDVHFPAADLLKAAEFEPNSHMTLAKLYAINEKITEYYNRHGYVLARAYLPAQDITNGTVTIIVLEGRYGQIGIENTAKVSNAVVARVLRGVNPGDPVEAAPLERRLLIISDLPGTVVSSTLSPGTHVGTADLLVSVRPGPRIDGDVEADNAGNPYTGSYRVGGTVNWNEPLGIGDVLSLRTLESTDGDLSYVRGSYQATLGVTTLGAALTGFRYRLGRQFQSLNANGWEGIASLYASYPLIRSYNQNLNLTFDADQRLFQDNLGFYSTSTNKRASVLTAGLNGFERDGWGAGGITTYGVGIVGGDFTIETPAARFADAVSAHTAGGYAKLTLAISRLQNVAGPFSLYMAARGQVASKNLDVSEKMELGGAGGVRGYPEGEAYGDDGYIATLEPRLQLPRPIWLRGQLQAFAFIDTGYVKVEHTPYTNAPNGLTRSAAGIGLNWSAINGFDVSVTYADLIGGNKATSFPDNSGEFWFEVVKYF